MFGLVNVRMSLLPCKGLGELANSVPRKSVSCKFFICIMVPMAPSKTKILEFRSSASFRPSSENNWQRNWHESYLVSKNDLNWKKGIKIFLTWCTFSLENLSNHHFSDKKNPQTPLFLRSSVKLVMLRLTQMSIKQFPVFQLKMPWLRS